MNPPNPDYDALRRKVLLGAAAAAATALTGGALAQSRTDDRPRQLDNKPMPEPAPERSAGPVKPGRGSMLTRKVAVVTGPRAA
jgi:hypothetical protein